MEYRLNKFISNSGYCSRREADKYIETGQVLIDGKRAKLGARVFPKQKVMVNGILIEHDIEPVYIALNKPVGIVSTTDRSDRDNIVDYISHEYRIFPIGRLDKDSQGLILLTNDGDIVNKILRVGNQHEKEYIVTLDRPYDDAFLESMSNGVPILDRVTRKCKLERINDKTFKIVMTQGLNRQIRRMCEYFNYDVVKLERTKILNIELGKLGTGNWRDLTNKELDELFTILEKSKNTQDGSKPASKVRIPKHSEGYGKKARRSIEKKQLKESNKRVGKQRPDKVLAKKRRG